MLDLHEIFFCDVTVGTLLTLHEQGFEFVVEDGQISEVIC